MDAVATDYGTVTVLTTSGRIDMDTAADFGVRLMAVVERTGTPAASVVVDFAGVEYISSVGLRALMVAAKSSKRLGGRLAVASLQPVVREIFEISRFNLVVTLCETTRDAIALMSKAAVEAFDAARN